MTTFVKQSIVIFFVFIAAVLITPHSFLLGSALWITLIVFSHQWKDYLINVAPINHTIGREYGEVLNLHLELKDNDYNLNIAKDKGRFYISVKDYGVNLTRYDKAIEITSNLYFIL